MPTRRFFTSRRRGISLQESRRSSPIQKICSGRSIRTRPPRRQRFFYSVFLFCFFFGGGALGVVCCSHNSNTPAAQALLSMRPCFVYTCIDWDPTFRWCQPHRHTALLISAILACTHLFFHLSTRPRVCFTGAAGEVARIGRIGGRGVAHRLGESEGAIPSRRRAAQAQRL